MGWVPRKRTTSRGAENTAAFSRANAKHLNKLAPKHPSELTSCQGNAEKRQGRGAIMDLTHRHHRNGDIDGNLLKLKTKLAF